MPKSSVNAVVIILPETCPWLCCGNRQREQGIEFQRVTVANSNELARDRFAGSNEFKDYICRNFGSATVSLR